MASAISLTVAYVSDIQQAEGIEHGKMAWNEIAQVSSDTMKRNGLEEKWLLIENPTEPRYKKIVALVAIPAAGHMQDDEKSEKTRSQVQPQSDTMYVNRNVMLNINAFESDMVQVSQIGEPESQQLFSVAQCVEMAAVGEIYEHAQVSRAAALNDYLAPYFRQKDQQQNNNVVVRKGELINIEGKRFKVTAMRGTDQKHEFGLVDSSTKLEWNEQRVGIEQQPTAAANDTLEVKELTFNKLQELGVKQHPGTRLNDFDTSVLLSKALKRQLFAPSSAAGDDKMCVVFVKGKKGKSLFCSLREYDGDGNRDSPRFVYLNDMMRFNLSVNVGDKVTVTHTRHCKRLANKKAARIFVSAIVRKSDVNTNDDYNSEQVLVDKYLVPYFSRQQRKVIQEEQIVSTFDGSTGKRMDFKVLEVEVHNDEDSRACVVDAGSNGSTALFEIDLDGIPESEISDAHQHDVVFDTDIGALGNEWETLKKIIRLSLLNREVLFAVGQKPTSGVLLHGAPGTGKTLMARALTSEPEFGSVCILPLNGSDILSSEIGESERKLKRAFKYVAKNAPGILFIDDLENIVVFEHIKAALISQMGGFRTNDKVLIIASTNKIDKVDVTLRRGGLFEEEIVFNVPDKDGRLEILHKLTHKMQNMAHTAFLDAIAQQTNGFVGADLSQLVQAAVKNALQSQAASQSIALREEHFASALEVIAPSSIKDIVVEKPNIDWDDIGGLREVKLKMQKMIENPLRNPEVYAKFGESGSRGALLWGPPGTGKTFLAKAIASKCNTNFIYVKGPELLSRFHGQSEANIRRLFARARAAAPTILFFDELDAIAPVRGKSGNSTSDRVVNQLLTEMDGIQKKKQQKAIFYLGATNRPDMIDPALKRPGRLEQMLFIDLPNETSRAEIFKAILKKKKRVQLEEGRDVGAAAPDFEYDDEKDVPRSDYARLAVITNGFSGADIKGVVDKAINDVVNEEIRDKKTDGVIDFKRLANTIGETAPSVSIVEHISYTNLKHQYEHQYGKKHRNEKNEQGYLPPHLNDVSEVKLFVFKIFGKNTMRAQDIYEFLVDPERGGYENLMDLLNTESSDIDELCYDLKIKYGNKLKFKRALMAERKKQSISNNLHGQKKGKKRETIVGVSSSETHPALVAFGRSNSLQVIGNEEE